MDKKIIYKPSYNKKQLSVFKNNVKIYNKNNDNVYILMVDNEAVFFNIDLGYIFDFFADEEIKEGYHGICTVEPEKTESYHYFTIVKLSKKGLEIYKNKGDLYQGTKCLSRKMFINLGFFSSIKKYSNIN